MRAPQLCALAVSPMALAALLSFGGDLVRGAVWLMERALHGIAWVVTVWLAILGMI